MGLDRNGRKTIETRRTPRHCEAHESPTCQHACGKLGVLLCHQNASNSEEFNVIYINVKYYPCKKNGSELKCCTVLYCIVLYCIALHSAALDCTPRILSCTVLYLTVGYCTVLYGTTHVLDWTGLDWIGLDWTVYVQVHVLY